MKKLCIFVLMLLVVATTMFAQEKPNVVIAPFKPVGDVTESDATAATELFTSQMVMQSKFRVIEHWDLDAVIEELHFQLSDWSSDSSKVQAVGKAVNAQYIVRGQLMKLGNQFFLSTTLLKIEGFEVVSASQDEFNYLGDILSVIPGMVSTMTEKIVPTVVKKTVDPIVGVWQAEKQWSSGPVTCTIEFVEDGTFRVIDWQYHRLNNPFFNIQVVESVYGTGYWQYSGNGIEIQVNLDSNNLGLRNYNTSIRYELSFNNNKLEINPGVVLRHSSISYEDKYIEFSRIR